MDEDRKKRLKELGKKIKMARRNKEMTQQELGEKIGKKQSYLSFLESGKYEPKGLDLLDIMEVLELEAAV